MTIPPKTLERTFSLMPSGLLIREGDSKKIESLAEVGGSI